MSPYLQVIGRYGSLSAHVQCSTALTNWFFTPSKPVLLVVVFYAYFKIYRHVTKAMYTVVQLFFTLCVNLQLKLTYLLLLIVT